MENVRFLGLLEPWEHIVNKILGIQGIIKNEMQ